MGYAGYEHLTQALHAWCGAHLLRDLRSISDANPDGRLWATAMANTLIDAHHAAQQARERGALARGRDDNHGTRGALATDANADSPVPPIR
jgi:transposase